MGGAQPIRVWQRGCLGGGGGGGGLVWLGLGWVSGESLADPSARNSLSVPGCERLSLFILLSRKKKIKTQSCVESQVFEKVVFLQGCSESSAGLRAEAHRGGRRYIIFFKGRKSFIFYPGEIML